MHNCPLRNHCCHLPVGQSACCGKMTMCVYQRDFGLQEVYVPTGHSVDQTDLHPSSGLTEHAVAKGNVSIAASSL